jgi:hypothetical protein
MNILTPKDLERRAYWAQFNFGEKVDIYDFNPPTLEEAVKEIKKLRESKAKGDKTHFYESALRARIGDYMWTLAEAAIDDQ